MKTLILLFLLSTSFVAQAQRLEIPKTVKIHNKATGEHIGTMTISDGKAYLRNKDGVHYATVVYNGNGTTTTYDPNGKVIETPTNLPTPPAE